LIENSDFFIPILDNKHWEKTAVNIFALFFSTEPDPGLSDGVNRFCIKSSVHSQLKRVTDRRTDGRKSDLNRTVLRNVR